jgi:glutamate--cysteine ligase catalytic subunit
LTNASWIRQFVLTHPLYKQDSIVSDEIQYDLVWKIMQIANRHEDCFHIKHPKMDTLSELQPN